MGASRKALVVVCLIAAACDIPTELPIVQQEWIVPAEETTLGVDELLPSGVSIAGSDFAVTVSPANAGSSLGTLCPACAPFDGMVATVPAFNGTFSNAASLPADVSSVDITSGTVQLAITNGFDFDPLVNMGSVNISVRNGFGGPALDSVVLQGPADSLPSGMTVVVPLTFSGAADSIVVVAVVDAPGGQTAMIEVSDSIDVVATTTSLLVGSATVDLTSQSVTFDSVSIGFESLEQDLRERVLSGSIELAVTNPFGVAVSGSLTIATVTKPFTLSAAPTSTLTIGYTGMEMQDILATEDATLSGSGLVSGTGIVITPSLELHIDATLDVIVEVG